MTENPNAFVTITVVVNYDELQKLNVDSLKRITGYYDSLVNIGLLDKKEEYRYAKSFMLMYHKNKIFALPQDRIFDKADFVLYTENKRVQNALGKPILQAYRDTTGRAYVFEYDTSLLNAFNPFKGRIPKKFTFRDRNIPQLQEIYDLDDPHDPIQLLLMRFKGTDPKRPIKKAA